MGFQLHPIDGIVNVNWAGGKFAVVGTAVDTTTEGPIGVFYSKDGKEDSWNHTHVDPDTPKPPAAVDEPAPFPRAPGLRFNYLTAMVGGKLKKDPDDPDSPDIPIIVTGGLREDIISVDQPDPDDPSFYHYNTQTEAPLFWSDNGGREWTKATNPVTAPPPSVGVAVEVSVSYLAFDPEVKKFYADIFKRGQEGEGTPTFYERTLLVSDDGKNWTIEASDRHDDPAPDWTSPFLNKIKNIKNNGLTEIANESGSVTLTYSSATVVPSFIGGDFELKPPFKVKHKTNETTEEIIVSDITVSEEAARRRFMGFAYSGGIFMIAGSLDLKDDGGHREVKVYISTDSGDTWKLTMTDSSTFLSSDQYAPGGIDAAGCCGCGV